MDMGGIAHFFSLATEVELSTRLTMGSRVGILSAVLSAISGSCFSATPLCIVSDAVYSGCVRSKIRCLNSQDKPLLTFARLGSHIPVIGDQWFLVRLAFLLSQVDDRLSFHNCLTGCE